MSISVKVTELGTATVTIELEEGATLADALAMCEKTLGKGQAFVSGTKIEEATELADGDSVMVAGAVKGGC